MIESDQERHKAIDALFEELQFGSGPGLALGMFQSNRAPYLRGFGYADLEHRVPIIPGTALHIASVSKHMTAFAIGLLARDGKVDLKADIREYLPFVPDFGHSVSVNQLIYHTSGLRDQWFLFHLGGQSWESRLQQQYLINMVGQQRALSFPPGSEYSYSNTGYSLLAEIVRVASGQTLRQFAAERMFEPLGMARTFFMDDVTDVVPDIAHSYSLRAGSEPSVWQRSLLNLDTVGATGAVTTVEDMIKWGANFAKPMVGDRALLEQMGAPGRLNDGTSINYGFGLFRLNFAGHEALAHNGAQAGFRSFFAYFAESELSVFVCANHPREDLGELVSAIANIYLNGAQGRFSGYAPTAIPPLGTLLEDLSGYYIHPFEPMIHLQRQGQHLRWRFGTGEPSEVIFREDGTFDTGSGTRSWCYFRPDRDESGRVTAIEDLGTSVYNRFRRLERIEPISPSMDALAGLVGDYRCAELDITYSLAVKDGQLTLASLWSARPLIFQPAVTDRFDSEYYSMRIARDDRGGPKGFWIHGSRLRHVWFDRILDPTS